MNSRVRNRPPNDVWARLRYFSRKSHDWKDVSGHALPDFETWPSPLQPTHLQKPFSSFSHSTASLSPSVLFGVTANLATSKSSYHQCMCQTLSRNVTRSLKAPTHGREHPFLFGEKFDSLLFKVFESILQWLLRMIHFSKPSETSSLLPLTLFSVSVRRMRFI